LHLRRRQLAFQVPMLLLRGRNVQTKRLILDPLPSHVKVRDGARMDNFQKKIKNVINSCPIFEADFD